MDKKELDKKATDIENAIVNNDKRIKEYEEKRNQLAKDTELFELYVTSCKDELEGATEAFKKGNANNEYSVFVETANKQLSNKEKKKLLDTATEELINSFLASKNFESLPEIKKRKEKLELTTIELVKELEEIEQEKEQIKKDFEILKAQTKKKKQAEQEKEEQQLKRKNESIVINSDYAQFSNQKLSREILHKELKRNEKIPIYKNNNTEVKDVIAMFKGEPHRLDNIDLLIAGYCSQIYKEFKTDSSKAKEARTTVTDMTKLIYHTERPNKRQIDEIIRRINNMQEMILVLDVSYNAENYKSKYKGIDPNRLISRMFLPVDIDTLPVRNKKGEIIRTETNIYIKGQSPVYYHADIIGQLLTYEKDILEASIGGNGLTSMFIKLFILRNIERIKSNNKNMKPTILFDTFFKEMQADENKELTKKAKKNRIESACKFLDYLKEEEYIKDWSYKTNNKKENVGWNISADKKHRKRVIDNQSKKVVSPDQQRAKKLITD